MGIAAVSVTSRYAPKPHPTFVSRQHSLGTTYCENLIVCREAVQQKFRILNNTLKYYLC
ncbi:hypothetical protein Desaci_3232 [Desulfosporosinus acidiphilus SJ4]|uniref:Uncharacterized protein n=1 Tax=Desulfosporosinus acidiphilus (strain DSM 22704 / JCM 16185 / SJ4) TaxID=646529 RepID=I4D8K9_DESAJ|nr:hypothetical protein Desaci_3232 [Desulfosporosinus acidiphilus SJ4]